MMKVYELELFGSMAMVFLDHGEEEYVTGFAASEEREDHWMMPRSAFEDLALGFKDQGWFEVPQTTED